MVDCGGLLHWMDAEHLRRGVLVSRVYATKARSCIWQMGMECTWAHLGAKSRMAGVDARDTLTLFIPLVIHNPEGKEYLDTHCHSWVGESRPTDCDNRWGNRLSEDGIGSNPLRVGVYVGQHLSFTRNGQTTEEEGQGQNRTRENP